MTAPGPLILVAKVVGDEDVPNVTPDPALPAAPVETPAPQMEIKPAAGVPPVQKHSASFVFVGAVALAWAGTAGVVWAGFKATAKFDETDLPL
jgi:hypothetical protein